MRRITTLLFALLLTTACADTLEPETPGDPFCLEECLERETDDPESSEPESTDPPESEPEEPETEPEPEEPEEPETKPEPEPEEATLVGTFVSGHLGYYDGCPERAWSEDSSQGRDGDGAFCEDPDNCQLPCDPATLVIRLTNEGDNPITGVHVSLIELYDEDEVLRAELPHEETRDLDTGELFDGTLETGEEVMLRIEFAGPLDPFTLLQPLDDEDLDATAAHPGVIETTFSSENHDDLIVESTDIYPISNIDT